MLSLGAANLNDWIMVLIFNPSIGGKMEHCMEVIFKSRDPSFDSIPDRHEFQLRLIGISKISRRQPVNTE